MRAEWPTLGLLALTYAVWVGATLVLAVVSLPIAVVLTGVAIALFSSLQHEAIHGHPTQNARLNALLVFPAMTLIIPYLRFRDTHLAHHNDSDLTDPYDDPESNYFAEEDHAGMSGPLRWLWSVNNTLLGRLMLGPVLGTVRFLLDDWRNRRDPSVWFAWLLHLPAVVIVVAWVLWSAMPFWAYCVAVYIGLSLLRIRTFLEHRAHDMVRQRSVIIEDRGPLALLFLNNNLHVVHHMHPSVPWYRLPALYETRKAHYLGVNGGYRYGSYFEIFKTYLLRRKDPVVHPNWRRG